MDAHQVLEQKRPNWFRRVAYAVIIVGVFAAFAALGVSLQNRSDTGEVKRRVERAGEPCVDANGDRKGLVPSEGCEAVYRLLIEKCVRDPMFCLRSERAAVRDAQERSADGTIGPRAQRPGGGGRSPGTSPRSPTPPSRPPQRDGEGGGGGGSPQQPSPGQPNNPPTGPQPQNPQPGPPGSPGPQGPPGQPNPPPAPRPVGPSDGLLGGPLDSLTPEPLDPVTDPLLDPVCALTPVLC